MKWIDVGKTYTVEVLGWEDPTDPPSTDSSYQGCVDLLGDRDFFDTNTLVMKARRIDPEEVGCAGVRADIELPVKVLEEPTSPQIGVLGFGRVATVRIANGCVGEYFIGLKEVTKNFQTENAGEALSDYWLEREFRPQSYRMECSGLLQYGEMCADSWYVRIRGPSGELISKDLAEPRDAGP